MEHLTKKLIDKTCERLWTINGSLKGLGGLFTTGARDICFDGEEFYGVGQLLRKLGEETEAIEDLLRCGQDSMADKRNGIDREDDDTNSADEVDEEAMAKIIELIKEFVNQRKA